MVKVKVKPSSRSRTPSPHAHAPRKVPGRKRAHTRAKGPSSGYPSSPPPGPIAYAVEEEVRVPARKYRPETVPNRKLLLKEHYTSDPKFGSEPSKRPIDELIRTGIINVDKPAGPSSHQVTAWVRDIFEIERAGHGGTLDPNVTGVLPTALNDATKAVRYLLLGGKEYVGLMRFHRDFEVKKVEGLFEEFTSKIYQLPPVRSAVKREIRVREIYALQMLEHSGRDVLFRVDCEAGTYIRVLAHDLGEALGTGAHLQQLRRTRASVFTEAQAVTLQDVKDAVVNWRAGGDQTELRQVLLPFETILEVFPRVIIKDSAVNAVCYGADLAVPGVVACDEVIEENDLVQIQTGKGEIVAVGAALMGAKAMIGGREGVCAKTKRVFMPRDLYPKVWGTFQRPPVSEPTE